MKDILYDLQAGKISVDEAEERLKENGYVDLGYAKVDLQRKSRQGVCEVIYGAGKTAAEIKGIVQVLTDHHEKTILITRMDEEKASAVRADFEMFYDPKSKIGIVGTLPEKDGLGKVVVATGGTSDIAVADEAAYTLEALGNEVVRLYDVGVAGLHRLLSHLDELQEAKVVIAIAGMEGALASVIGGLVSCPVIAVPTSVGYGASFHGLTALLAMLNSCASGVSVVNIDNGFGAGFLASRINHMR